MSEQGRDPRPALAIAYMVAHGYHDWVRVFIDDQGDLQIKYRNSWTVDPERDEILYGALVTAGECADNPLAFSEWKRGR